MSNQEIKEDFLHVEVVELIVTIQFNQSLQHVAVLLLIVHIAYFDLKMTESADEQFQP